MAKGNQRVNDEMVFKRRELMSLYMRILLLLIIICMTQACLPRSKAVKPRDPIGERSTYSVKKGDTLSKISRKHHISLSLLMDVNNISDPKRLQIGQKLIIPGKEKRRVATVKNRGKGKKKWAATADATLEASLDPSFLKPHYQTIQEFLWPIDDPEISSSFGRRFMFDRHHGVDLRAPKGTPVYAAAEGTVIFAGRYSGYGKMITIEHQDDVITKYAHNHKNIVRVGQKVASGQQIATVGSSGNASGYHLHFELVIQGRTVNPENYLH